MFGGAHNQAVRLTPLLREKGWETVVVLPEEEGDALERLLAEGIDVVSVPLDRLRMTPNVRSQARLVTRFRPQVGALSRLIREVGADIAQLPGVTSPQAAVAARREGAAVVWQLLDTRPPELLRRAAMPIVRRLADVVMTTGVEVAKLYPGASELGERWVPFVPPVDPEEFEPDGDRRRAARAALGVEDEQVVIGTVGNRNPQKGHEYLIRAMSIVRRSHPAAVLRARGNASPVHRTYECKLQRELQIAGLDKRSLGSVEEGMGVAGILARLRRLRPCLGPSFRGPTHCDLGGHGVRTAGGRHGCRRGPGARGAWDHGLRGPSARSFRNCGFGCAPALRRRAQE